MKRVLILAALTVLAGCGSRAPLRPPPGGTLPPAPRAAPQTPTAEQLMTPSQQARPQRADELLRRSEERIQDRFDLPPGA